MLSSITACTHIIGDGYTHPYSVIYVCIYIYIYVYVHTHTHTQTHSNEQAGEIPLPDMTC